MLDNRFLDDFTEIQLIDNFIYPIFEKNNFSKYYGDDSIKVNINSNSILLNTDKVRYDITGMRLNIMNDFHLGEWLVTSNISDIVSSGGTPKGILLNLSFPKKFPLKKFIDLLNGISNACINYQMDVLGGDLSTSSEVSLSATVFGDLENRNYINRSNSQIEDIIFCQRYAGLTSTCLYYYYSALPKGLKLNKSELEILNNSFLKPPISFEASKLLSSSGLRISCMDNSDGLGHSFNEISRKNNCGLDINALEIHEITYKVAEFLNSSVETIVCGPGADYTLVGTIEQNGYNLLQQLEKNGIVMIGTVDDTNEVKVNGEQLSSEILSGWNHFGNWQKTYK